MPFFTSQANTYRAQVGNSVTLFCQVENLGKSFIILNSIEFYSEKIPLFHILQLHTFYKLKGMTKQTIQKEYSVTEAALMIP